MFSRMSVALLLLASAVRSSAQTAVVEGVVTGAEDSSVIANALVRLQAMDGNDWVMRDQRLTNANGRFRFAEVVPDRYRVQLLRIGYRPVISETTAVSSGSTNRIDVRGAAEPVVLSTVSVYANSSCLSAAQLASDGRLAELWRAARTGVETRRAFEHQYSFRRTLRQDVILERRLGGKKHQSKDAIFVNIPDSADERDARRKAINREQGYASSMTITMPDEKEILDDAFLAMHCIETGIEENNGAFALRFRPVRTRSDIADVRGRVWIDATTYQVRRLEVEYLRGNGAFADAAVDYSDVVVGGKPLRMPGAGIATLRPSGITGALVKRATSRFNYIYENIQGEGR